MIFEPIWFRETYVELYGKRGISGHGNVVLHRQEYDNSAVGDDLALLMVDHIA